MTSRQTVITMLRKKDIPEFEGGRIRAVHEEGFVKVGVDDWELSVETYCPDKQKFITLYTVYRILGKVIPIRKYWEEYPSRSVKRWFETVQYALRGRSDIMEGREVP